MSEILQVKDNKVLVSDEAMLLPEFQTLFKNDKSKNKERFFDIIFYVYYVYKFDGPLKNMYPEDRKAYVCNSLMGGRVTAKEIESSQEAQKLISLYYKLTMSFIRRDYEQTKQDIESLNKHISGIPFTKRVLLKNQPVSFEYEGKIVNTTTSFEVDIDNSEEKAKALKLKETLYDLEEKLKMKAMKEDFMSENPTSSLMEESQQ